MKAGLRCICSLKGKLITVIQFYERLVLYINSHNNPFSIITKVLIASTPDVQLMWTQTTIFKKTRDQLCGLLLSSETVFILQQTYQIPGSIALSLGGKKPKGT